MKHADYLVRPGRRVSLEKFDPAHTGGYDGKDAVKSKLRKDIERLAHYQDMLYAQNTWALLVMFQAMDAAGKDGTIKHVMSGVNPQGCQVFSFKAPSAEDLDHDYLWRCVKSLPERGRIGIFNRSYYEETLVVRVHPELLARQQIPKAARKGDIWKRRYREINDLEKYLVDNGIAVLKFFLHVSKEEQRRRFLERIDDPAKNWKFSAADVRERAHWEAYMRAYERMLSATSTTWAPWYVVPADAKWFTRLAVADIIVAKLRSLKLAYPTADATRRAELQRARKALAAG